MDGGAHREVVDLSLLLVLLTAVNVFAGGGDGEPIRRIAGIAAFGEGRHLTVVELADGEHRLVGEGAWLGEVEVVEITDDWVRLRYPDGERRLEIGWVEGGVQAGGAAAPPFDPTCLQVSRSAFKELGNLVTSLRAGGVGGVATTLNQLLGLPDGAHVVAINNHPLASPVAAVKAVYATLSKEETAHLSIANDPDRGDLYVTAGWRGSPTGQSK